MMLLAIFLAGIVFYEVFVGLRTLTHIQAMMETSQASLAVVQSSTMSDEDKAAAMQSASLKMFGGVFMMVAKLFAAGAATAAVLYAISLVRWSFNDLLAYSIKPIPLVAVVVFLIVYGKIRHGRHAGK
ncbi:MAG: hypothetical protein R3C51_11350 [Parvularculaceae bacterium]